MLPDEEKKISSELDLIDSPRSAPYEHLKIVPKKDHKAWKVFFIILLVIIFLVIGGYIAYLLIKPLDPAKQPVAHQNTSQSVVTLTAASLVAEIRAKMIGDVKTESQIGSNAPYPTFNAPVHQPDGYLFSVRPSQSSGFASFGTSGTKVTDLKTIEDSLISHGLKKTIFDPGTEISVYAAGYTSKDITCSVNDQKPYTSTEQYRSVLGCANTRDYLANAKINQPFYDAYVADTNNNKNNLLFDVVEINQSKTANFKIATIGVGGSGYGSVGGFAALFYQTPDTIWHYFTGTQSKLPCTRFDTIDLKQAYLGESCYGPTNEGATVLP